jgi:hypothetical protein
MPVDEISQIAHWIEEATAERGDAVYLADARSPRRVRYRDLAAAPFDPAAPRALDRLQAQPDTLAILTGCRAGITGLF